MQVQHHAHATRTSHEKSEAFFCNDREQHQIAHTLHTARACRFPPHVTLVPGMKMSREQAVNAAQKIAQSLKRYTLRFQGVSRGTFFFQCVFILIEQVREFLAFFPSLSRRLGRPQCRRHIFIALFASRV